MRKALFLDRDGVINQDLGYVYRKEDVRFVEGIFDLCRTARDLGYFIICVTNQSGIARGLFTIEDYLMLDSWLKQIFEKQGLHLHSYYCPHHPEGAVPYLTVHCCCRKPEPGLLEEAIRELNIARDNSLLIGDQERDVQAARRAAIGTRVLLKTGQSSSIFATHCISTLAEVSPLLT